MEPERFEGHFFGMIWWFDECPFFLQFCMSKKPMGDFSEKIAGEDVCKHFWSRVEKLELNWLKATEMTWNGW